MVKLASKHYEHVPPAKVTVNVVANLFVAPHPAFVIQGGAVDYHAEQMKSNRFHRIDLSNSQQYYVRVGSEDLASNHTCLRMRLSPLMNFKIPPGNKSFEAPVNHVRRRNQ